MDLLNTAPSIGEFCSTEGFPGVAVLSPNFGRRIELHNQFVKGDEKESGEWVPAGDWMEKGHGVIVTTQLTPEDYREFLTSAWPESPLASMHYIIVAR